MSSWIASMYSCSSLIGFVSSKRRWQRPPNSWAIPKLSAIDLGWPMWRYPFGSGGKRVTTSETRPSRTSAATISRMKSLRSGVARLSGLTPLLLITSKRLVLPALTLDRVLVVADVVAPGGGRSFLVGLLQGDVRHEAIRRRPVPVLLARREEHTIAGPDARDRPAAPLTETMSFEDEDRLPVRMGVPGSAGPGRKVHERG